MATRGVLYVVFLLPVIFSTVFGTIVMADILQKPDRELKLWGFSHDKSHNDSIEIIGIEKQYLTSQIINFTILASDPAFDCGDLYITIYSDDTVILQEGFFNQCFSQDNHTLPINEEFSGIIDVPGTYEAVVELFDADQKNSLVISEKFTIK